MFGYIRPAAERLSEEDNELFRSAYCGLCHAMGRRYGASARFLLNYDFTLLAILLSLPASPACGVRRCAAHPLKGCKAAMESPALYAAADCSIILAWWQIQDHIEDLGFWKGLRYRLAALPFSRAYRTARSFALDFDAAVRRHLEELHALERKGCTSIDAAAEPFAALLAEIASIETDEKRRRVFSQLFYHLGRWIYLIDAADDFAEDAKSGNYNPLRFRYGLTVDELSEEAKRSLAETLDASIRRMGEAYALLDAGAWQNVLDSIFYESFFAIGKAVLDGSYHKAPRWRRQRKNKGESE